MKKKDFLLTVMSVFILMLSTLFIGCIMTPDYLASVLNTVPTAPGAPDAPVPVVVSQGQYGGAWEATGNINNNNSGSGPTVITFSGNGAVISGVGGTSSNRSRWVTALTNGTIRIGDPCVRNIQSAGTANTWVCDILVIASNGTASWTSTTIVLGEDGILTVNGYSWYKRR